MGLNQIELIKNLKNGDVFAVGATTTSKVVYAGMIVSNDENPDKSCTIVYMPLTPEQLEILCSGIGSKIDVVFNPDIHKCMAIDGSTWALRYVRTILNINN